MINYIKQAFSSLRSQPLVSWVSVSGTALAIFMIMAVVMIEEVEINPYAPESNRDRWLVQRYASITNDAWEGKGEGNGPMSYDMIKKVFYAMETPEAVTATSGYMGEALLSEASGKAFGARMLDVDHGFWKVMDFSFINGTPFNEGEFESGKAVAVLSETTARRLFGTTEAAGRDLKINHVPYRVKGVVRDVSSLASAAYADVWVPYTSTNTVDFVWNDHMGSLGAIILPKSKADIPKIREEYTRLMDEYSRAAALNGWKFIQRDRPYDQETAVNTPWANAEPDMKSVRKKRYLTWAILLLVPAVNLSSMTHSRLTRRREEIGVRRAFGARRSTILAELFIENLIITIIAGIIGMLLSVVFAVYGAESMFEPAAVGGVVTGLTPGMLLSWKTFGLALLFCFILNLISASLPAWQASRTNVVNALAGKN